MKKKIVLLSRETSANYDFDAIDFFVREKYIIIII